METVKPSVPAGRSNGPQTGCVVPAARPAGCVVPAAGGRYGSLECSVEEVLTESRKPELDTRIAKGRACSRNGAQCVFQNHPVSENIGTTLFRKFFQKDKHDEATPPHVLVKNDLYTNIPSERRCTHFGRRAQSSDLSFVPTVFDNTIFPARARPALPNGGRLYLARGSFLICGFFVTFPLDMHVNLAELEEKAFGKTWQFALLAWFTTMNFLGLVFYTVVKK